MKRQFCHAKFQKSNQKPIFISQNSIIMETDKCLFALIYIFQKLSGLIYLRNSFRFCVETIASSISGHRDVHMKNIRNTRKKEQSRCHQDYMKEESCCD